jgi:hypothetical protein
MDIKVNKLQKVHKQILELIDSTPQSKRNEKLFGKWTLREVLAHLSGWDKYTSDLIDGLIRGKERKWGGRVSQFNLNSIKDREGKSWDEIYKEWKKESQRLIDSYNNIPKEYMDQRF